MNYFTYPFGRVRAWLYDTFSEVNPNILEDVEERGLRFGEESLELIQSLGIREDQATALVKQVYGKPVGDPKQELGGVTVTLASLCAVTPGLDPSKAFETEMKRVETPEMKAKVREKHRQKSVISGGYVYHGQPVDADAVDAAPAEA